MPSYRRMFIFNAAMLGMAFLCAAGNGFVQANLNYILASVPLAYLAAVFGVGAYEMRGLTRKPPVSNAFIYAIAMLMLIMAPSFFTASEGKANEQYIVVVALFSLGAVWFYREMLVYEVYRFQLTQQQTEKASQAE